jgi:hypothetical protein
MSRLRVFDLGNYSRGDLRAFAERGWQLIGKSTSGSGTCTISLKAENARLEYLQFGRMVLIQHPKLPNWAGMIDTPWMGTLPVQMTLYDAQYLLSLRKPENAVKIFATTADYVRELLRIANEQEELYIRLGDCDIDDDEQEQAIEQRSIWDQLKAVVIRKGAEMVIRPEIEDDQHLVIYLDVLKKAGKTSAVELRDGQNGNMRIISAKIEKKIINGVVGINGQKDAENRLQTAMLIDEPSRDAFRLRTDVIQFQNVKELSTLTENAQASLLATRYALALFEIEIFDVDNTFKALAPGNTHLLRASRVYLPGGIVGWSGYGRIYSMQHMETSNVVRATVSGSYINFDEAL